MRRTLLCSRGPAVAFLIVILCLSAPARVEGDSAPLQAVGRTLVPKTGTRVRMVEETVIIDISYDPRGDDGDDAEPLARSPYCGRVRASFAFEAPAAEELLVGFPLGLLLEDGWFAGPVKDFRCTVDGRVAAHTVNQVEQPGGPPQVWATWQVAFPKGRTRIEVEYRVPFEVYRPWANPSFWYVLNTGRYWAGNIGRAVVSLGLTGQYGTSVPIRSQDVRERTTKGWRIDAGRLVWEFRDIEPDFDIEATIKPLPYLELLGKVLETVRGTGTSGRTGPSGAIAGMDAAQAAYFVTRLVLSVDSDTCAEAGLKPQDIEPLWRLAVTLCRDALSSSNDKGLHRPYLLLLRAWHGTDRDPDLLGDYLAETVQSYKEDPWLLDEVDRESICKRAVRWCALGVDGVVSPAVQALRELSITPDDVGREVNWTGDVSGLPPDTLKKAQVALGSALAGSDSPEQPRAATANGAPVVPAVDAALVACAVLAACAVLLMARARGLRRR